MKLSELAVQAVICFEGLFEYFDEELTPKNSRLVRTLHSQSTGPHAAMVENIRSVLNALLGHLINTKLKTYDFDHTFREKVHELTVSVGALSAKTFGEGRNPELLNIFKSGMSASPLNSPTRDLVTKSTEQPTEQVLSTEGRNCAKVCLTILETVNSGLKGLRKGCIKSGSGMQINLSNGLGKAFQRLGYDVASSPTTQDGELRNKKGFTGENIYSDLLVYKHNTGKGDKTYQLVSDDDDNKEKKDKHGVIRQLNTHLGRYYYVSHYYIPPNPKSPSNIYHLLQWLLGLYFNPIYSTLGEYFKELFEKPENYKDKKYSEIDESQLSLLATTTIRPKTLKDTLRLVCLDSADTLIAFLGHGHPDGRYAVDFYTNTDGLSYPSNAGQCFDMLVDILNRVFYQLRFLCTQCSNSRSRGGWQDCHYGQGVGGSSWNCNTMQCPNQIANQNGNQSSDQNCEQPCNQHPKCGIKSPLQSFLEDGLQGFLPHQFTKPGCKLECTVPNHRGKPCLTPMGFADIGTVASRTKDGVYLWKALYSFCGPDSDLRKLCCQLNCLLRRPPQTLGDMFAFYYQFLQNYSVEGRKHKKDAFDEAVRKSNFGDAKTELDFVSIQGTKSHSDKHSQGDLFSLTDCDSKLESGLPCGPYLASISEDIRSVYSKEHAGNYLSWIVYLTQTFYDLLKQLCEQCCNKCNKQGINCRGKKCGKDCTVKYTDGADIKQLETQEHRDDCQSILKCPDTHPTLYTYGFTFGSPHELSGGKGEDKIRTCQDLCEALENVCHGKSLIADLVINKIPEYLWNIRSKFSYLLLTLWSLSLLYLLHITVVRLDVLRIRSHLKSPSSHRIAAQSLLAAARAKALANVKYFSP
ncbi:hypothetical protein, conserved [Babesia ovata]|uniref:Uncharacterized protein n=1 Tax=Babesia ovata TaxID=189622 RepID=A0A2H6KKK0_9APIC|nr:uncharacterized protein BOVATA_050140 [Babesia ovata]GBE63521.1 hypothetical protein, conserved [Babesia ovata]